MDWQAAVVLCIQGSVDLGFWFSGIYGLGSRSLATDSTVDFLGH